MNHILCIDPSSTIVGFAVFPVGSTDHKAIESGRLKAKATETPRERVTGLVRVVELVMNKYSVTEVFIEDTSAMDQSSTQAKELLATVKTLIKWEAESRALPFYEIPPQTIKKHVVEGAGMVIKGAKKKEHSMAAVEKLSGQQVLDNNQSDAWALAYTVMKLGDALRVSQEEKRSARRQANAEKKARHEARREKMRQQQAIPF